MANVISPAADPIWSRTVLFVRGHRWANRPEPDQIMDHLWRQRPIITGNSELLRSKAGQQAAILLVNLMARICPGILIDVPRNIPLIVPKNPLINHDYLFDALAAVPLQIWGEGCKGPAHDSELALSIGSWPASRRKPHIVVRFGSWWGGAFENDARADNDDSDSSGPGSLVAACLGAAAAYKTIVRRLAAKYPLLANDNTSWDLRGGSQCLSVLDYSLSASDGPQVSSARLALPVTFVSAGAITSAVVYAMSCLGLRLQDASIFDPKIVDAPDLNRYITLCNQHLGRFKTEAMAEWLSCSGKIECRNESFVATGGDVPRGDQLFVVGVDHIPSRWEAQRALPMKMLIGATEQDEVRISAHRKGANGLCALCLDRQEPELTGALIPTISFVSALTGITVAAELLKETDPNVFEYRLSNVAGGRLLQLSGMLNWSHRFVPGTADCRHCAA